MAEGALSGFATGFGRGLAKGGELSLERKIREDIEKLRLEQEEAVRQKRQLQDLKSLGDSFGVQGDPLTDPAGYRKNLIEAAAKKDYRVEFGSGGSVSFKPLTETEKALRDMTPEQRVVAAGGVRPRTQADVLDEYLNRNILPQGTPTPIGGSGGGAFPSVEAAPSVVPKETPFIPKKDVSQQFLGSSLSTPNIAREGVWGRTKDFIDAVNLAIANVAEGVVPKKWAKSFLEFSIRDPERLQQLRGKQTELDPVEYMARARERGVPTDKLIKGIYEEFGEKFPFKQAGPMRKGDIPEAFNSLGTPPKFF